MKREVLYCPECMRKLGEYDKKATMKLTYRCDCGRYFSYDPVAKKFELIKKPERTTSSGVRFY